MSRDGNCRSDHRFEDQLRGKALVPDRAGPTSPSKRAAPSTPAALPQALEPLATAPTTCLSTPQAMASELQARKALLGEVQRNLQAAKQCSGSLASRFQEHCPDLERQEAEVQKLCQRFDSLCQQAELRSGASGMGRLS